tara:strand:+ start:24 stop:227 length:204 start_codon:yes stop_codon:yes gene_type:complete
MPKIFKENKFALFLANIFAIVFWISFISLFKNLLNDNLPFYLFNIVDLIKLIPPFWLTYYLWIVRKK